MQAYDEATETVTVSVRVPQRECKSTEYARRSTVEGSLDTGSIPVYSTLIQTDSAKTLSVIVYLSSIFPLSLMIAAPSQTAHLLSKELYANGLSYLHTVPKQKHEIYSSIFQHK